MGYHDDDDEVSRRDRLHQMWDQMDAEKRANDAWRPDTIRIDPGHSEQSFGSSVFKVIRFFAVWWTVVWLFQHWPLLTAPLWGGPRSLSTITAAMFITVPSWNKHTWGCLVPLTVCVTAICVYIYVVVDHSQ